MPLNQAHLSIIRSQISDHFIHQISNIEGLTAKDIEQRIDMIDLTIVEDDTRITASEFIQPTTANDEVIDMLDRARLYLTHNCPQNFTFDEISELIETQQKVLNSEEEVTESLFAQEATMNEDGTYNVTLMSGLRQINQHFGLLGLCRKDDHEASVTRDDIVEVVRNSLENVRDVLIFKLKLIKKLEAQTNPDIQELYRIIINSYNESNPKELTLEAKSECNAIIKINSHNHRFIDAAREIPILAEFIPQSSDHLTISDSLLFFIPERITKLRKTLEICLAEGDLETVLAHALSFYKEERDFFVIDDNNFNALHHIAFLSLAKDPRVIQLSNNLFDIFAAKIPSKSANKTVQELFTHKKAGISVLDILESETSSSALKNAVNRYLAPKLQTETLRQETNDSLMFFIPRSLRDFAQNCLTTERDLDQVAAEVLSFYKDERDFFVTDEKNHNALYHMAVLSLSKDPRIAQLSNNLFDIFEKKVPTIIANETVLKLFTQKIEGVSALDVVSGTEPSTLYRKMHSYLREYDLQKKYNPRPQTTFIVGQKSHLVDKSEEYYI